VHDSKNRESRFLGFIELAEGIRYRNALGAMYASFISIGILNFTHFARPFILLEIVGIDQEHIGRFTGYLSTWIELLSIALAILVGIWADRYGRRILYILAALFISAGYLGLAFVQTAIDFIIWSTLIGMGSAFIGTLLGLIMVDYPSEGSRGKWTGLNGVMNGLGIVCVALGVTKIPAFLGSNGMAEIAAMQVTLVGLGIWCVVSAIIFRLSLITGVAAKKQKTHIPAMQMLREGLEAGRKNPKLLLAYMCFVVSRADLVVVATYFTLWVQDYARGTGISPTDAVAKSGMLFALIQGTALFWAPIFGYMLDKIDRVLCIAIALSIAGTSYVALGLSDNPLASHIMAICVVVGIGQISVILGTQSLIGQEAEVDRRGTIVGIATFCGTLGLFVTAFVGGIIYDVWMPGAPLLVFGVINLVIVVPALTVWHRGRV
jgi:MFS family permease